MKLHNWNDIKRAKLDATRLKRVQQRVAKAALGAIKRVRLKV